MIYGRVLINLLSFVQDNGGNLSKLSICVFRFCGFSKRDVLDFRLDLQHSFNTDSSSTPQFVVCFCFEDRTTL